uniref:EF-hand calcium binding domain 5 n=1 Tax=Monodelphis domestica TaxID=13616 RepID=F6VVB2_MONDO
MLLEVPIDTETLAFPWKENFFDKIEARSMAMQNEVIHKLSLQKEHEKKMAAKYPVDDLANEWLSDDKDTLDTQAYLLEKLLPTLIPGVEKMLMEVEKRKLLGPIKKKTFDPINYLGEYLMRNNPNYQKDLPETGYLKAMKNVTKVMKTQIPDTPYNRVFKIKKEVKENREKRENIERIKTHVGKVRKEALTLQFQEWILDPERRLPLPVIENAAHVFLDTSAGLKTESLFQPMEFIGSMKDMIDEEHFIEVIFPCIKELTSEMFTDFLRHLYQCSGDFYDILKHDQWRQKFLKLFFACDVGKLGFVDRERTLTLLENFYDKNPKMVRRLFYNPKFWPFVEFEEIEPAEFWGDLDDERSPFEKYEQVSQVEWKKSTHGIAKKLPFDDMDLIGEEEQERKVISWSRTTITYEETTSEPEVAAEEEKGDSSSKKSFKKLDLLPEELPPGSQIDIKISQEAKQEEPSTEQGEPSQEKRKTSRSEEEPSKDQEKPEKPSSSKGSVEEQRSTTEEEDLKTGVKKSSESEPATEQRSSTVRLQEPEEEQGESSEKTEPSTSEKAVAEGKEISSMEETTEPPEKSSQEHSKDFPQGEEDEILFKADVLPEGEKESSCEPRTQLIEGKPWSGDLLTSDLSIKYMKYGENTKALLVSDDPRFLALRPIILKLKRQEQSRIRSAFSQRYLNLPQFVQLLDTFVSDGIPLGIMKKFNTFFKKNYMETEDDKINSLEKIYKETIGQRRKLLLDALFEKWDNEGSGFLELQKIDNLLFTYKEGMEKVSMNKAKMHIVLPQPHPGKEVRLTISHFRNYIELVVAELTGNEDEVFDNVVEFLMMSLKPSHVEQLRNAARHKWLERIQRAAETSRVCLQPIYTEVFKALTEDAEAHGYSKRISAHIAFLEENKAMPERGSTLLRNVACTAPDVPYVLNQVLYRDMSGISFAVVDKGEPIHVPEVDKHGNIHFWNTSREPGKQKGSFLAIPLQDAYKRSFGVLGVDTLRNYPRKTIFSAHEISFYQGVANAFSIAYHHIHSREHILHVIATAAGWLRIVTPSIKNLTTFLVEAGPDYESDYALQKIMYLDNKKRMEVFSQPSIIYRKESLFRDYLFKSADTSQVVFAYALGTYHITAPLRDRKGVAMGVIDFSTGQKKVLPNQEYRDLQKMLKIVQTACKEILGESTGEIKKQQILEMEYQGDVQKAGILFFRIMLKEIQERIRELDPQAFKNLKFHSENFLSLIFDSSNFEKDEKPPSLAHDILKAILLIFNPEWEGREMLEDWNKCRQLITNELIQKLCNFDPTAEYVRVYPEVIAKHIKRNPRKIIWAEGSVALEYMYHWALTCLFLVEIKFKLENKYILPLPAGEIRRKKRSSFRP